jgi:hypothetical protein
MNLIPSPATINDGTSDHIFTFQQQKIVGKSIISTWKELAAASALASTYKSKYNASDSTILRNVGQVNKNLPIADESLTLATLNLSAVYHREHTLAELTLLGETLIASASQPNFWLNFFNQM